MKETYYATITSKGQITIPKAVRETLAVYSGDRVAFTVEGDNVAVEGISSDIEDLIGSIKPLTDEDPGDFDDMIERAWSTAAIERWERVNRQ